MSTAMKLQLSRHWTIIYILNICLVLAAIFFFCTGCDNSKTEAPSDEAAISSVDPADRKTEEKPEAITLSLGELYSLKNHMASAGKDSSTSKNNLEDGNSYSCADPTILAINQKGQIHATKAGTTTITVKNGDTSKDFAVTVKKRGMVYPTFSMMKGEKLALQFSKKIGAIRWKSSNGKVASVNKKGRVTAKAVGTARITGIGKQHTYVCRLKVTKKIKSIVYLTFDDGPSSYSTPKILKILKKNNVKATFFELRPASYDYHLTKRIIDEGHTLALHGFQHKYDIVYKSMKTYHGNLDKLRNLFFRKFGVWCTISRFPGGSSNTVSRYNPGIMTRLTNKLDDWGYTYFDWNVASGDAGGAKNKKQVYRNVTTTLQKNRANVVLMHDYTHNDKTIDALDKIIKFGKKNGYTFLPLSASTEPVHHGVNN